MLKGKTTYIFIDGGYLRRRHAEILKPWFDCEPEIDYTRAIQKLEELAGHVTPGFSTGMTQPTVEDEARSFYYDCLDEERREKESDEEFEQRLNKQSQLLRDLRDVHGCHIRLGSLKGAKNRKQKEVDVLLAVDMMAHAARGNMDTAALVAGDLDFRPAVDALVQLGVSVHIISEDESTARELTWAASSYSKLTFDDFYDWVPASLKSNYPIPFEPYERRFGETEKLKDGSMNEDRCALYMVDKKHYLLFPKFTSDRYGSRRIFSHEQLERLELYFRLRHRPIIWTN